MTRRLRRLVLATIPRKYHFALERAYIRMLTTVYAWWYAGDRVECPCCGGRFRRFLPHGSPPRPTARCPGCLSLERHRLIWMYLRDRTDLFEARLRMLHIAPEDVFRRAFQIQPNLAYVCGDIDPAKGDQRLDVQDLPFQDAEFDVIICNHVLEHVPDDRKAMTELYRVLAPGGWAICQVPLDQRRDTTYEDPSVTTPEARKKAFGQHDHVRLYGTDYRNRLVEAGFDASYDGYVRDLDDALVSRYGLRRDHEICVCRK